MWSVYRCGTEKVEGRACGPSCSSGCTHHALSTVNAVLLAPAGMAHGVQARWLQWPTTVSVA